MTTELWYLYLSAILLSVLWIPFIVGQVMTKGPITPDEYRELRTVDQFPAWVRRANRAHINLVEQFGAFAALIILAHLTGISTTVTAVAAAVFFWARILHAIVMLAGITQIMLRTLLFTVAWIALLVIAWEILMNAG